MAKSLHYEIALFLAGANLDQVLRWQSVDGEIALHHLDMPWPERQYLALQIVQRIERDERAR